MDDSEKCTVTTLASIEEEYNDTQLLVSNILEDVVGAVVKTVDNAPEEKTGKLTKMNVILTSVELFFTISLVHFFYFYYIYLLPNISIL